METMISTGSTRITRVIESYQTLVRFTAARDGAQQPLLRLEELDPLSRLLLDRGFERADIARVVLCGEVKAGKSTLLNAICGEPVAATDHFEMTGWIARYWPAEEPFARIHRYDGTEEVTTPAAFLASCCARAWGKEDLASIQAVDIGLVGGRIPVAFIDAPGMGSIRRENEARLMSAVDQADLVAWILDVDALGPERVAALARTLNEQGTPQIAIITKCDLLEDESETSEIRRFAARTINIQEDRVFFTSAERALRDAPDGPPPCGSGLRRLLSFLSEDVSVRRADFRAQAERAYVGRIADLAAGLLGRVRDQLAAVQSGIDDFDKIVGMWREAVQSRLEKELKEVVREKLFSERRAALAERIGTAVRAGGDKALKNEVVERIFHEVLGPDYYRCFWQKVLDGMSTQVAGAWSEQLAEFAPEIERAVASLSPTAFGASACAWSSVSISERNDAHAVSTFKDGMKTSLGIAGVASAWAWVGSTAAHVTLGAALGAVGFPILLMGAGVSAGIAWWRRGKATSREGSMADAIIDAMREQFGEHVLSQEVFPRLSQINGTIASRISESFSSSMMCHLPTGDLGALAREIDERLTSVSGLCGNGRR